MASNHNLMGSRHSEDHDSAHDLIDAFNEEQAHQESHDTPATQQHHSSSSSSTTSANPSENENDTEEEPSATNDCFAALRRVNIVSLVFVKFRLLMLSLVLTLLVSIQLFFLLYRTSAGTRRLNPWLIVSLVLVVLLLVFIALVLVVRVLRHYHTVRRQIRRERTQQRNDVESVEDIMHVIRERARERGPRNPGLLGRIRARLTRTRISSRARGQEPDAAQFIEQFVEQSTHRSEDPRMLFNQYLMNHLQLSLRDRDFTAEDYDLLLRLDEAVSSRRQQKMTKRQLRQFPTFSLTSTSSQLEERCSVCMEDFCEGDQVMLLSCFHCFHKECVTRWLLDQSNKCPVCMKKCDGSECQQPELEHDPVQSPNFGNRGEMLVDL